LKKILIVPFKITIFEKFTFTNLSFASTIDNSCKPQINRKYLWQTADLREKPVCMFLNASPVRGADRRRNISGHYLPLAALCIDLV
jgi:hypothetical protein